MVNDKPPEGEPDLLDFLLDKCVDSHEVAHAVHWHLYLEKTNDENFEKDPSVKAYFEYAYNSLLSTLDKDDPESSRSLKL